MGRKLYVGNLPFSADQQSLQETFSKYGTVDSINLITDRDTGRSRGFGFIEMSTDAEAQKAMQELNGTDCDGRPLTVNEAKPQQKRSGGGGHHRNSGGRSRW
jgi:RNA recognition motif-containing protein